MGKRITGFRFVRRKDAVEIQALGKSPRGSQYIVGSTTVLTKGLTREEVKIARKQAVEDYVTSHRSVQ